MDSKKPLICILIILAMLVLICPVNAADTTAPRISGTAPASGTVNRQGIANFSYTPVDLSEILWCRLVANNSVKKIDNTIHNNTVNAIRDVILENGTWNWKIQCMDNSSNIGDSSTRTLIVKNDTKKPVIELNPGSSSVNGTGYGIFRYTPVDSGRGISFCELIVDNEVKATARTIRNNTQHTFSTQLTRGEHLWTVNCTDWNGNEGYSNTGWIEAAIFPTVTAVSPANKTTVKTRYVTFEYKPVSPIKLKWCNLILNGNINQSASAVQNNTVNKFEDIRLINGTWLWKVNCTDWTGNTAVSKMRNLSVNLMFLMSETVLVELIEPLNRSTHTVETLDFSYKPVATYSMQKCELITNGSARAINSTITVDQTNVFGSIEMSEGLWEWKIKCMDSNNNSYTTNPRIVTIIRPEPTEPVPLPPELAPVIINDTEELEMTLPPGENETTWKLIITLIVAALLSIVAVVLLSEEIRAQVKTQLFGEVKIDKLTELEIYITEHLDKGFDEDFITNHLNTYGWKTEHIRTAFKGAYKKRNKPKKKKK